MLNRLLIPSCLALVCAAACGDDGGDADRVGIAAVCTADEDCRDFELPDGGVVQLQCLTQFKGGYCGVPDCLSSAECPLNSICVAHDDGRNYCFRVCDNKPECNVNRPADDEANCSSSFDWAVPAEDAGEKACIPPSA
ncbi:MAG: hypothetical protein JJ863_07245 [Deltaproteobacteria bacterium]|nr:hypothetical protein [Deltaproteobacteria bacterium]